jgi:nitrite reductase (NADH) small subunit
MNEERALRVADADLPAEGALIALEIAGEPVVLARRGGKLFAIDGICPHAGAMLGDGELDGDEVVCPYHGWGFHLGTGVCRQVPTLCAPPQTVETVDGGVVVRLSLAGPPRRG